MFSMGVLKVIQGSFEGCCKGIIKLKLISTLYGIKRGGKNKSFEQKFWVCNCISPKKDIWGHKHF